MENTSWHKQTLKQPLFPDILWSKPQNRSQAGKLLIVGGNAHGFAAPAAAFAAAIAAGAGQVRVLLPDSTKKVLGTSFAEAEFTPSTPSGSFSRQALAQILDSSEAADLTLLAGDFGRNSETAIMLDSFLSKYNQPLVITQDGLDYFLEANSSLLQRQSSLLVVGIGQLQKLATSNRPSTPVLHKMTLHEMTIVLADLTNSFPASFITKHADHILIAVKGQVSTTPISKNTTWQVELAAYASVWWLQQPKDPFESLSTAAFDYLNQK